jgi:predicted nucleotidyltransferase
VPRGGRRFASACQREPLVVAAFLGGSFAAGTATDTSDIDIYIVTEPAGYDALFACREAFVSEWGEPVTMRDIIDFEGLGFDMVDFVLSDGVHGQLAFGHTGNFLSLHGGPHEVLVDKTGLLDGVVFPLL